jgi:hypothetical protein
MSEPLNYPRMIYRGADQFIVQTYGEEHMLAQQGWGLTPGYEAPVVVPTPPEERLPPIPAPEPPPKTDPPPPAPEPVPAPVPEQAPIPPVKRKRGRPRKR